MSRELFLLSTHCCLRCCGISDQYRAHCAVTFFFSTETKVTYLDELVLESSAGVKGFEEED